MVWGQGAGGASLVRTRHLEQLGLSLLWTPGVRVSHASEAWDHGRSGPLAVLVAKAWKGGLEHGVWHAAHMIVAAAGRHGCIP